MTVLYAWLQDLKTKNGYREIGAKGILIHAPLGPLPSPREDDDA